MPEPACHVRDVHGLFAGHVAGVHTTVTPETAESRGLRSHGSEVTVQTRGLHHLHDVSAA